MMCEKGEVEEATRRMGMKLMAVGLGSVRRLVRSKEWQNGTGTSCCEGSSVEAVGIRSAVAGTALVSPLGLKSNSEECNILFYVQSARRTESHLLNRYFLRHALPTSHIAMQFSSSAYHQQLQLLARCQPSLMIPGQVDSFPIAPQHPPQSRHVAAQRPLKRSISTTCPHSLLFRSLLVELRILTRVLYVLQEGYRVIVCQSKW